MRAVVRRLLGAIGIGLVALALLPASVAAECNGPPCGEVDPPVEGLSAGLFVLILVAFGTVMAISEARRR